MPEPTNEPIEDDRPEPQMTSAEIDDVEVFASPDQYPTPDLSDLNLEEDDA